MTYLNRRDWLASAAGAFAGYGLSSLARASQIPGDRPARSEGVSVINPRGRVPLSVIIDDSTCLVNLAHFAIPQFAQVFPDRYTQDWKALPREIPDAFVRKFAEWCHSRGVKGKYSIVPAPACVGWLDRELPGWSASELKASLDLVRTAILPDWDIHPEMVTHTWVIDIKTGRPYPDKSDRFMENWRWTDGKSVDELAAYLAYALRILKNAGLPCEGITTPGGFGNRVLPELSQASFESVREVYGAEIPHYFRHLYTDDTSVAPRVEYASGIAGPDPRCVVSIIGCTGDWFGGWDGLEIGHPDQFITEDGQGGRLPEVIARGEPAILVGHWPGFYCNGQELGFNILQKVVDRLDAHYPETTWMKLSEIARYWAARELTSIIREGKSIQLHAPYACPAFTLEVAVDGAAGAPSLDFDNQSRPLQEARPHAPLVPGSWRASGHSRLQLCFDLPRGACVLEI